MSNLKRKQHASNQASNSAKKRQKLEEISSSRSDKISNAADSQTIAAKSLLSKEQPAFPRGGAGPLTILERKQIRAKASSDVARELENGDLFASKQNASAALSDESEPDVETGMDRKSSIPKKKKKQKSKNVDGTTDANAVRIESLSHKKLSEDSLLLGRIASVGVKDLTISLPNNLTGFVSLADISTQFYSKLEKAINDDSDDELSADARVDVETDLNKHFKRGQMLRFAVKELSESGIQKKEGRNRINLSTMPKLVNKGLTRENLAVGITIQAAVISVEDHGLVVDLGFEDNTTGFISLKMLPTDIQMSDIQVGAVLLCAVTKIGSKGKTVQLSANLSNGFLAKTAPSVDAYLPGTFVEVLLTQVTEDGLAGKVLGLLDVTADAVHSEAYQNESEVNEKYQIGQKVTGRLIANFPRSDQRKLAFSVVEGVKSFDASVEDRFELSSVLHRTKVVKVVPGLGLYLSLPSNAFGFAHISRLSDKSVDSLSGLSGQFKIGSEHEARILDYNSVDNLYILSLQRSVLDQPYLRLEDISIGELVTGTIERSLLDETGIRGLILKVAPGIHGIVKPLHFSDTVVQNPEKRFREGMSVKARVLTVEVPKRRIELTLKKSIINSDQPLWSKWEDISVGDSSIGTIIKIEASGALMQFCGPIKGRLPVSEMSEAYIRDATEHFKLGQVLTVYAIRVDLEKHRLILTARDPATTSANTSASLVPGTLVSGTVFEKSADDLLIRLSPQGTVARLHLDHVSDGSSSKRKSAFEKIRVGQQMEDILVLNASKGRLATISNKMSLRNAAREEKLLKNFEQLTEGAIYTGFISNITENRIFVCFADGITGVINKPQIPDDQVDQPDFGMKLLQPVSARVVQIDYKGVVPRFWLSMKTASAPVDQRSVRQSTADGSNELSDPVDEKISSYTDLVVGLITKARITSVKDTQINVELAKGVQGRVDVSEMFDKFEDIKDRKHPLRQFSNKQILTVKILGQHDSRTYKFLPLSHRGSKNVVFELSARPSMLSGDTQEVLTLGDIKIDSEFTVFVNNVSDKYLMVNVTPAVRGRIQASEASDDLNLAANLAHNFPVGSAMKAKVTAVDVEKNRLDLSAKTGAATKVLMIDNISAGDIVAGKITKITDHSLLVQLSESLVGSVELINIADNFDLADPARFQKNEIVRAYVLQVDKPNKRVHLSMRPSKILSSGLEIADPEVTLQSLNVNEIRRGFVDNVFDKGVFINLAPKLNAFVRVTNLSDEYFKEWKEHFQRHQLVKGKIIAVDKDSGHVQMSLRKSHIDGTYRPKISFTDLKVGEILEAKVAKVETFGIFIEVINSERIRGLCHRSEIADKRVEDATKLGFSEGDPVKAKVLKIEPGQRRVNFGMKASYFADELEDSEDDSIQSEQDIAAIDDAQSLGDEDESFDVGGVDIDADEQEDDGEDEENDRDQSDEPDHMSVEGANATSANLNGHQNTNEATIKVAKALSVGGFDWFGMAQGSTSAKRSAANVEHSDSDQNTAPSKKKKRKAEILVDHTADLDTHGPQTPDDFDRLLLSDSANASLWIQYMAHYISLGDIDAARSTGSRALASIPASFESEKQLIWVAMLNLENTFGDDEAVEATLQRACETMEPEDMHARLASIYIQSDKHAKADALFQSMLKKFTQNPKLWINYATFLFDTLEAPTRARALLPRALQALPPFAHFDITSKFAQLEFKTKTGVAEEGRTRFQGLVNLYPKRLDLFNVMLDLEMKLGDKEQVRGLFEQVLSRDGLKPAKVKPFFQRWLAYEKKEGDERKVEEVEARAAKWVSEHKQKEKVK